MFDKQPCVFVDGEEVTERLWYVADSNPYKRWLEDDFEIPAKYTKGKKSLNIRIVPVSMSKEGKNTWNEAEYQVFVIIIKYYKSIPPCTPHNKVS